MKEINYKEMKFNPFNLIGDEWMQVWPIWAAEKVLVHDDEY